MILTFFVLEHIWMFFVDNHAFLAVMSENKMRAIYIHEKIY